MEDKDVGHLEVETLLKPGSTKNNSVLSRIKSKYKRITQEAVFRTAVVVAALIAVWYALSTSLSLYNKKLLGKEHGIFGQGGFPAPLLMCCIQFMCQWGISSSVIWCGSSKDAVEKPMTWKEWAKVVLSNGITTGLDIGFSNKSLAYISMSFYTMCKSTTPVFLLLFAFLWRIEKPSWALGGVVTIISTGLLLLVQGELHHQKFSVIGFCLVMSASALAGFRFTITQLLLHDTDHHASGGGPVKVMQMLMPVMAGSVGILSLFWEQLWVVVPSSPYFATPAHCLITLLLIGVGAILAFLMVWAEFKLIQETSALTFIIAGTLKEVVTVVAAVMVLGDRLSPVSILGLVVVILGVLLFNIIKYYKLKRGEIKPAKLARSTKPSEQSDDEEAEDAEDPLMQSPTARLLESGALPGAMPVLSSGVMMHHR